MRPPLPSPSLLADLRQTMERVSSKRRRRDVLPFGIPEVDTRLPSAGLSLGAVHEISEGGVRSAEAAIAPLFAAGILARIAGPVLWCLHSRDLFAPALARVGLHPDRVIYCETWKDSEILPAMEDGLRHRGLAGVVGELMCLPLTPSRRLQLAAEDSGVVALVIRRSHQNLEDANAAFSRWRVSPAPSAGNQPLELGRARWNVELLRCRGAEPHSWLLEACDAKGRLSVPADVRDRSRPAQGQERASA